MRLSCPNCGERDRREFTYQGDAQMLQRPDPDAGAAVWDRYLHLRENPAGATQDLWYHEAGCGAWLLVARDTLSHEISSVKLASEARK